MLVRAALAAAGAGRRDPGWHVQTGGDRPRRPGFQRSIAFGLSFTAHVSLPIGTAPENVGRRGAASEELKRHPSELAYRSRQPTALDKST